MTEKFQSLLILSTGRTGTKYLAKILQTIIPDADVYHEAGEQSRLINIFSHAYLAGLISEKPSLQAWQHAVLPNLRRAQADRSFYVDANNHIYQIAVNNPDLYPNLKVIHIVRDPREYIRSHINWTRTRLKSFIANHLIPFWQPTGYMLGNIPLGKWMTMTQLEKFAWIWNYKNLYIKQLEISPTPYLRINFEDLFLGIDSLAVFKNMLNYMGVRVPEDLVDHISKPTNMSKHHLPSWVDWPMKTCRRIDKICGVEMRSYGYGLESEWRKKIQS